MNIKSIIWSFCSEKYYFGSLFTYAMEVSLARNGNSLTSLQPPKKNRIDSYIIVAGVGILR
jgi:hypothetical protein